MVLGFDVEGPTPIGMSGELFVIPLVEDQRTALGSNREDTVVVSGEDAVAYATILPGVGICGYEPKLQVRVLLSQGYQGNMVAFCLQTNIPLQNFAASHSVTYLHGALWLRERRRVVVYVRDANRHGGC